jgi:hypothetical protein
MCVCLTVCGGQKPENLGFYLRTGAAKVYTFRIFESARAMQQSATLHSFKSACMLAAKIQHAGRNNVQYTRNHRYV